MDLKLTGKVAVITGGSVGIGLAIAEGLAAEGVNLVLGARNAARVEAEAARVASEHGIRAIGVACDVATFEGTSALIGAAERTFYGADILINNAGPAATRPSWTPRTKSGSTTGTCTSWRRCGWHVGWCPGCAAAAAA